MNNQHCDRRAVNLRVSQTRSRGQQLIAEIAYSRLTLRTWTEERRRERLNSTNAVTPFVLNPPF